jgi:hypothetical protein
MAENGWATLERAFKNANKMKAAAALKRSQINPGDKKKETA